MKTGFEIRAVQLDLARQMESMDFIKNFIDFIADNGYNTLFLYLEWRIRTAAFDIGANDGYTPEEISQTVRYAASRGIEVIPGLACFGHCELLLTNSRYQHLCELRGNTIGRFWGSPRMELCPSLPETRQLLQDYFTEAAALFPSKYLHIGGDEVANIGCCEICSKKAETFDGEQNLYGDHIRFCHSLVTGKLGKRTMMWDDMSEVYPDAFQQFPRDIIMVNWQYQKNAMQWEGHFNNIAFHDQMAYYEKNGFDYLIAPADYHWSNIETLTASTLGRRCLGGILTTWEKKDRLMQKYFPMIAATGALWSDNSSATSEKLLHNALAKLFDADDELLLNAVKQYLELYAKGAKISPETMTVHPADGPDWEDMRSLRTAAAVIADRRENFTGKASAIILEDILRDLQMQEAAGRLKLASFKMLHGQPAESLSRIAADIKMIWDGNIAACKKIRSPRDAAFFTSVRDKILQYITDFEEKYNSCARIEMLLCLPDYYEAEKLSVRILADDRWQDAASGVFKCKNAALYWVNCFIPEIKEPSEIELSAAGFGGQGICYVDVRCGKECYVPQALLAASGEVCHPDHILTPDATFAYIGFQRTLDAYHDRHKAHLQNTLRISLRKQK